jgi:hypothetical protein
MNRAIRLADAVVDWFIDWALAPLLAVAIIVALISALVGGISGLNKVSCYAYGEKMGIEVEHTFFTGCMIHVSGTWLPWTEVVPVLRDGKVAFEPKPMLRLTEDHD